MRSPIRAPEFAIGGSMIRIRRGAAAPLAAAALAVLATIVVTAPAARAAEAASSSPASDTRTRTVKVSAAAAAAPSAASTVISDRNVPVETGARRETVVEGLEQPWGMAFLPDGRLLITERPGRLRIVEGGKLLPAAVTGVPEVFAQGQGGLLDVAVHPRFADNGYVYLTYAHGTAEANRTRVSRGKLVGGALGDVQVIFDVNRAKTGGSHFGSRLAWLPDGTLLVSIGDGGNPPTMLDGRLIRDNAQDPAAHLGKVVRLREDVLVPAADAATVAGGGGAQTWTLGHRNVQGLAYDPFRRTVWATEHGALGGDELNRLEASRNYGWPVVSRTREYVGGAHVGISVPRDGMTEPVLLWEVAVAPSGLVVYDGRAFPYWRGDLFSGSLMSADVRRIDLDDAGRPIGETALRAGARVRDVEVGPDGLLYVLTDERAGRLLRYSPAPAPVPAATAAQPAASAPAAQPR
jgi:glucose/arabinose dehydrogenase